MFALNHRSIKGISRQLSPTMQALSEITLSPFSLIQDNHKALIAIRISIEIRAVHCHIFLVLILNHLSPGAKWCHTSPKVMDRSRNWFSLYLIPLFSVGYSQRSKCGIHPLVAKHMLSIEMYLSVMELQWCVKTYCEWCLEFCLAACAW